MCQPTSQAVFDIFGKSSKPNSWKKKIFHCTHSIKSSEASAGPQYTKKAASKTPPYAIFHQKATVFFVMNHIIFL